MNCNQCLNLLATLFIIQMMGREDLNDLACAMNLTTYYLPNSEQVL